MHTGCAVNRRTFAHNALWYDLRMIRRVSYRAAVTGLVFSACWLVFGFLFLMTPIPDALGIGSGLTQIWIVTFFVALGVSGSMLTFAAINGIFPPVVRAPTRRPAPLPARAADAEATRSTPTPQASGTRER